MRRFMSLLVVASSLTGAGALVISASGAGAAPARPAAATLPVLNVALTGTQGVSVSGSTVSGAVQVVASYTGKGQGEFGLVRLDPGVTLPQAAGAVQSHHGDINALDPYGALVADASAPGSIQTVLTPGNWVALNITSQNGQPAFAPFTVAQAASPAALPGARSTETSIEFNFRGPAVLHNGTMVRAQNGGYLVHMIELLGVRNAAGGRAVIALLRAGKDHAAQKLATRSFVNLAGPISPGGLQQEILHAKPGYYVEACFMDTQDGREHTSLGMERLVRVVK